MNKELLRRERNSKKKNLRNEGYLQANKEIK